MKTDKVQVVLLGSLVLWVIIVFLVQYFDWFSAVALTVLLSVAVVNLLVVGLVIKFEVKKEIDEVFSMGYPVEVTESMELPICNAIDRNDPNSVLTLDELLEGREGMMWSYIRNRSDNSHLKRTCTELYELAIEYERKQCTKLIEEYYESTNKDGLVYRVSMRGK